MCSEMCVLEQSPRKARGIWGFVHPRLCLVSDVEVGFQLFRIRMRPLGAENGNKASCWGETSKDGFVSGVFSVCPSKAKRHLVTSCCLLCVCVNIAEFYFHMQLKVVYDANLDFPTVICHLPMNIKSPTLFYFFGVLHFSVVCVLSVPHRALGPRSANSCLACWVLAWLVAILTPHSSHSRAQILLKSLLGAWTQNAPSRNHTYSKMSPS